MQENRFQLAGYLASKPTLRGLPSSTPVANARLGQTYRSSRNDQPAEHTNWFRLAFYGDLATLAMALEKGTNLYVEGTFDQRPYVGEDRYRRYIYEVTVQKFFVVGTLAEQLSAEPPEAAVASEVLNDGTPPLESPESEDTWLL